LSREDNARKIAKQILKKYNVKKIPVDLYKIAKGLKINITKESFSENISGVFIRKETEDDKLSIGVNKNHHEHRQRFTVGHEIGHYLLHSGAILHYDREEEERQLYFRAEDVLSLDEIEANQFSAALLMPEDHLTKDFAKIRSIKRLAKKYNVSKTAMEYRLVNLGLM
jgi:Zn-dependent peptidase ImmA (M78 family)